MSLKVVLFLFCVYTLTKAQYEGDPCLRNEEAGVCKPIQNCQTALDEFKKHKIFPQRCSFAGSQPVVCCVEPVTTTKAPLITTTSRPREPVTDDIPVYDYVNNDGTAVGSCEPISPTLTATPNGQKAWDKCLEYQQKLIYPCERGEDLTGTVSRGMHCHHNADELIIGGDNATEYEFPHMALLGYGDQLESVQWVCAGSLLSENYVLTAGHCTVSRNLGPVTYALMGVHRRSQAIDQTRVRRIKRIITYPQYAPPRKYHDIALLELSAPVTLSQYIVPACLDTGLDPATDARASATGWGLTTNKGAVSDILQKVILNKFSTPECSSKFTPNRLMKQGFDQNTQICYGDKQESKDTCQGDSGGPLQIKSTKMHCMYLIVGVTSFGKECGHIGEPAIYTRVAHYVPWIESVVWP